LLLREEPARFAGWNDAKLKSVYFAGGDPGEWAYIIEGQPERPPFQEATPEEMIKAFTDLMLAETPKMDIV